VARPASGAGRQTHELEPHAGFAFTSAQIEVRADVPAGAGLWSALWLLSTMPRPRPEIDVMEILGKDPNRLLLHVHYELDRDRQSPGKKVGVADLSDGWHTFSLTWSAHELIGRLDGRILWRLAEPRAVPQKPVYLIANLAVGGELPGLPGDDTSFLPTC
jgi:beta-glucanase (GH16 family)